MRGKRNPDERNWPVGSAPAVEVAPEDSQKIPLTESEGVETERAARADAGGGSVGDSAPSDAPTRKVRAKRCVVCKHRVDLCDCKQGPLTRERYQKIMGGAESEALGENGEARKEKPGPQGIEDTTRFLLFAYTGMGSWLSWLIGRVPMSETNEIWAIPENKLAEILPRGMKVVDRYYDQFPAWLEFITSHTDLFMFGKLLLEMTAANIVAVKDARHDRLLLTQTASIPVKSRANGAPVVIKADVESEFKQ